MGRPPRAMFYSVCCPWRAREKQIVREEEEEEGGRYVGSQRQIINWKQYDKRRALRDTNMLSALKRDTGESPLAPPRGKLFHNWVEQVGGPWAQHMLAAG